MKYIFSLLIILALGASTSALASDETGTTPIEITVESKLSIESTVVNTLESVKTMDDNACCYESKAGRAPGTIQIRWTYNDGTTGNWSTYSGPEDVIVGTVPKCITE